MFVHLGKKMKEESLTFLRGDLSLTGEENLDRGDDKDCSFLRMNVVDYCQVVKRWWMNGISTLPAREERVI